MLFRFGRQASGRSRRPLAGYTTRADGGVDVAVTVTNDGSRAAGASCRISASGAPDFRDYVFFTEADSRRARRDVHPDGAARAGQRPLRRRRACRSTAASRSTAARALVGGDRQRRRPRPMGRSSACRLLMNRPLVSAPAKSSVEADSIARWNASVEAIRAAATWSGGTVAAGWLSGGMSARTWAEMVSRPGTSAPA